MKSVRRPRLALTVAALALSLGATGCSYMNPVQTHDFYQAADGTNVSLVDAEKNFTVGVRNAIVIVDDSQRGELLGSVVNYTDKPVTVKIQGDYEGTTVFSDSVEVPAHETVQVEPKSLQKNKDPQESNPIRIGADDFPVDPGKTMKLTMSADGKKRTETLPVTDSSLSYYKSGGSEGGSGSGSSDGGGSGSNASDGGGGSGHGEG
ncbi:hypothetical protein [Brachybacterium endophyticum]|uniref:hypothetical protein n=1 Tax=Brachybacterium endophyticum TaxID=2182385 RepID=UPI00196A46DC|nr:hypothetical protein [Brachybacterium endophyticum]